MMNDAISDQAGQAEHRAWIHGQFARAVEHFGLVVTGEPIEGWHLRSVSARALGRCGPCWVRVGAEYEQWIDEHWTGIPDSNVITGVPKPQVLHSLEWNHPDRQQRLRADVMTLMPGHPCSPTDVLHVEFELPQNWWAQLHRAVAIIRATPTTRFAQYTHTKSGRIRKVFGERVAETLQHHTRWETAHGDLHWNNLLCPEFGLLDWELWGLGPVGADAATLYCFSLLVPEVARRVHELFADVLDSPAGHIAQLVVASRILHRAEQGQYPDLANTIRNHIQPILDTLAVLGSGTN
jgi:hypothetical protein